MRVVLDTNVVVSGLIWGGKPYQLLRAATDGEIELFTSPLLLDELREVLARGHLVSRLAAKSPPSSVAQAVRLYGELAVVVSPSATPKASRDPDDDEVLACALAAHADFIVSGDKDLLTLGSFEGIPILTAVEAAGRIRGET
jgi:putative PIN family toxin of toxin-antitoxin system